MVLLGEPEASVVPSHRFPSPLVPGTDSVVRGRCSRLYPVRELIKCQTSDILHVAVVVRTPATRTMESILCCVATLVLVASPPRVHQSPTSRGCRSRAVSIPWTTLSVSSKKLCSPSPSLAVPAPHCISNSRTTAAVRFGSSISPLVSGIIITIITILTISSVMFALERDANSTRNLKMQSISALSNRWSVGRKKQR